MIREKDNDTKISTEQIEDALHAVARLKTLAGEIENENKTGNLMPAIRESIYNRQVVDALISAGFAIADKESEDAASL